MELVCNVSNLKYVIDILINKKRYLEFSNYEKTLNYVLHCSKLSSGTIVCDIEYDNVYCARNKRLLEYLEETQDPDYDDFTSVFSISILHELSDSEKEARFVKLMEKFNELYNVNFCPCDRRLVGPGEDVCLLCVLSCAHDYKALPLQFCCICQESSKAIGMQRMPCCSQYLHKHCAKEIDDKCPYCRCYALT